MKVEEYWYDTNQLLILKLNLIAILLCGSTKMGSDIQLDLYPMYNVQGLIINIGNNTSFRLFWIHKRLVTLVTSERASWETEVRDGTEINFPFDILFSVKNNKSTFSNKSSHYDYIFMLNTQKFSMHELLYKAEIQMFHP